MDYSTYSEFVATRSNLDAISDCYDSFTSGTEKRWRDNMVKALNIRIGEMSSTGWGGFIYDDEMLKIRKIAIKNLKNIKRALLSAKIEER